VTRHCAICEHPERQAFEVARDYFGLRERGVSA